jgi:hypothetical protein
MNADTVLTPDRLKTERSHAISFLRTGWTLEKRTMLCCDPFLHLPFPLFTLELSENASLHFLPNEAVILAVTTPEHRHSGYTDITE